MHHEEAGRVIAGDPLSLEAEDHGELQAPPSLPIQHVRSQLAPGLNEGCSDQVRVASDERLLAGNC